MKTFHNPPALVMAVMEGLCYVLEEKRVEAREGESEQQAVWEYAKKHVLNDKLQGRIREFQESRVRQISGQSLERLGKYFAGEGLEVERIWNASKVAGNLFIWVRSIFQANQSLMQIEKNKELISRQKKRHVELEQDIARKKHELALIQEQLGELDRRNQAMAQKQATLQAEMSAANLKVSRGRKLVRELNQLKQKWAAKLLLSERDTIRGNSLLQAGLSALLSSFTSHFRSDTMASWKHQMSAISFDFKIESTDNYPLISQW